MKRRLSAMSGVILFAAGISVGTASATPAPQAVSHKTVEATGCLEPGPVAKEYILKTADGTTWGVKEGDILMNRYVGQTVTVSGDSANPTASARKEIGAQHYMRGMDVVVESETCQK